VDIYGRENSFMGQNQSGFGCTSRNVKLFIINYFGIKKCQVNYENSISGKMEKIGSQEVKKLTFEVVKKIMKILFFEEIKRFHGRMMDVHYTSLLGPF